jgi:hypothetical protein
VRGEDTLAGRRGVGGSIFRKTPDTALYSIYVSTLCSLLIGFLSYKLKTDLVQSTTVALNIHVSIFEAIVSFSKKFFLSYTVHSNRGGGIKKNTKNFLVFTKYSLCSCGLIDAKIIAT